MSHLLRLLVRETIEASSSSSPGATPSTDTAPSSPDKDKDDGGDATTENPVASIEKYFSNTKNASDVKREDETKKLANSLKQSKVQTPDEIMKSLKILDRDAEGGKDFADKLVNYQNGRSS
jgi:hypothetical protein